MSSRWRLEIRTEAGLHGALVSTHEFDDLPSLRVKMVEHRGGAFLVSPPDQATQTDLEALLDLRSQGFLIRIQQVIIPTCYNNPDCFSQRESAPPRQNERRSAFA